MRVGLYGGTFDPIHNGHLHVISQLLTRKIIDHLLVVPAGQPRLRDNPPIATGAQRRQMCQLAINSLAPGIKNLVEVNPIEILRDGPSYAIDTVEAVVKSFPDSSIVLIVGSDAYEKIEQWHRAAELKAMVDFLIITRPGTPISSGNEIEELDIGALDISATEIRSGSSNALPAAVAAFIKENNLYAS
uniref:nicotinate (nicotinamide) nucleotide adenylyltransferase n=1 Tax=Candidatus Planktophila sp. TaxID=2175601 RepID=UPI0040499BA9